MAATLSARDQADVLERAAAKLREESRTPASRATIDTAMGAPHIREGEDPLSSRPLYLAKAARVLTGEADPSTAKFEIESSNLLKKALGDVYGQGKYSARSIVVPLSWDLLPDDVRTSSDFKPMREAMHKSICDIDPESIDFMFRKSVGIHEGKGMLYKTAMSSINQQTGGAMVAPAQFGDLIPLLRNKAVLPNIGAQNIPLPSQGSVTMPRQTGASTTYEKPENTAGAESNPTFDDVTLVPKEFIALVRSSNQLLQFAPGLAEATIRNDMMEQMALTFDLAGLSGTGGPNLVKGIINQAGIGTVYSKETGANGDTWVPANVARMIRKNQDRNSDVKTWIMRPSMWLGITETRADAVAAGDSQGAYLWNMFRTFGEDFGEMLRQRKVVTSNQIVNTQTKGSATDLTYILGVDGQEIMVGMHGAMVLDANPWEGTAYAANQTLFRAIMFGDVQIRRGAGIAYMPQLIVPNLDN